MDLRWRPWLTLVAVLALAGCEAEEIELEEPPTARLELDRLVLDFGTVSAGTSLTREVVIRNTGNAELTLDDVFIDGPDTFVLDETFLDRVLAPEESTVLAVTFAPIAHEAAAGTLHVIPGDPEIGAGEVTLEGHGLAQKIELVPADWTFDDLAVGCEQEVEIAISNVGGAPLELTDVLFAPTSEELEFSYYFGPGTLLNPGESASIKVYYTPVDELTDTGYLTVRSNDPTQPEAQATQTGVAHQGQATADTFVQDGNNWADILWVIDNSAAMASEQTALAVCFATFMDILQVHPFDYHLAVVTTDDAIFRGDVPVLTPGTPDVDAEFSANTAVGIAGSGTTKGLQMAWEALSSPYADPGGPNQGFLRDEATLHVIVLSGADDQSPDAVAAYVTALQGLQDDVADLQIHGIFAAPSPRYEDAIAMTGGGIADLHDPGWVEFMADLVGIAAGTADTFALSEDPISESIEMDINGVPAFEGWGYDPVLNAVIFQSEYIPAAGALITAKYVPLGSCDDTA